MKALHVLGYVRRSTDKQAISIDVQQQRLGEAAESSGWLMSVRCEDVASASSLDGRPILAEALADLRAQRADALAVAKLDRLCRDVAGFSALLNTAERQGWHIICLDLGVDTTTTMGRAMAQVTAVFAEMERRRIGERTREGMARIRATTGKHMGRPPRIPSEVEERILTLHLQGLSASAIARRFNDERVPKGAGSTPTWDHSHVLSAIRRANVRRSAGPTPRSPEKRPGAVEVAVRADSHLTPVLAAETSAGQLT